MTAGEERMALLMHWDRQYRGCRPIWDSDQPTSELVRTVEEEAITPCRTLELGCGTGTNAVWLAQHGFAVTAIDVSPTAILRARDRATEAHVAVRCLLGDLRDLRPREEPYDFFVDCGCFGAVQLRDSAGYLEALRRLTRPGSMGLVLTGNDHEPEDELGPPVLSEKQLRAYFSECFEIVRLREFRFDAHQGAGKEYLAWSCLLRRPAGEEEPNAAASGSVVATTVSATAEQLELGGQVLGQVCLDER
jgi:SAM-dependent methyltransferase